jgi:hypothetical protein
MHGVCSVTNDFCMLILLSVLLQTFSNEIAKIIIAIFIIVLSVYTFVEICCCCLLYYLYYKKYKSRYSSNQTCMKNWRLANSHVNHVLSILGRQIITCDYNSILKVYDSIRDEKFTVK